MRAYMNTLNRISAILILIAFASFSGCSKNENKGKSDEKKTTEKAQGKKAATQVAAKVNSTEITVSQINNVLARTPNITPETAEKAKREILDKLIDAQLVKEQAIVKKLDRSPNVLQALESSKTEILARAYVEQLATGQPKPTPEEAKKYYAEHPELFSERRVYNLEEISLPAQEGLLAKLEQVVTKSRTMQDIVAALKSQGIQFSANRGVRAAEQLPLAYLPQMASMKDGDIRIFNAGAALQVIRLVASKAEPVDEARAIPRIMQFLFNTRSNEVITKDMKQIREKAKIVYVGEFVASAEEAQAKAKAAAEAKAKDAAEAKGKAQSDARAKEDEIAKARRAAEEKNKADSEARAQEEEAAHKRRAAEAKQREEEAKSSQSKSAKPLTPEMEKGLRGVIR